MDAIGFEGKLRWSWELEMAGVKSKRTKPDPSTIIQRQSGFFLNWEGLSDDTKVRMHQAAQAEWEKGKSTADLLQRLKARKLR